MNGVNEQSNIHLTLFTLVIQS